jgi:hypothetical protein
VTTPAHAADGAVLAEGRRVLIDDPGRFDGVAVVGVDMWWRCAFLWQPSGLPA